MLDRSRRSGGQTTLTFAQPSRSLRCVPKEFSLPYNPAGYADDSISNDMISQVYLEFTKRTRSEESWAYLRTLTGMQITSNIIAQCARDLLLSKKVFVFHLTIRTSSRRKRQLWMGREIASSLYEVACSPFSVRKVKS